MPTTITVAYDQDRADYAVKFNGMISHRISQAQIDKASDLHKKSFWQLSPEDARVLGTELFRMIDSSGGRLQQELNKAKQAAESPELYLNLPPELDILPFELMFHNGFLPGFRSSACPYPETGKTGADPSSGHSDNKTDRQTRSEIQRWLRRKYRLSMRQAMKRWNYRVLHEHHGLYRMVGKVSHLEGLRRTLTEEGSRRAVYGKTVRTVR